MPVLKWVLKVLVHAKEKVWDFFDAFNNDELYALDKSDIFKKFIDYKVEDIEEFAAIYTFEYHDIRDKLDDRQSKEEMFKEVYETLQNMKKQGLLDR